MLVYVGKEITAATDGRRIVPVTCEKCRTPFYYELVRVGTGKASAPYFLFQGSASNRAEKAAQRALAERLGGEVELVPCPKCHWVNQELVDRYRQLQYRRAPLLIAVVVGGLLFVAPILGVGLAETFGYDSRIPRMALLALTVVCLLAPVLILLTRRHLRRRIDPNVSYPRWPAVPPGTPPPLVEKRDPQTGELHLEPVTERRDTTTRQDEWAVFRRGQISLPPVCCVCMAPASTTYEPPFKVDNEGDLPVPLCRPCSSRLRRRWWFVALRTAGIALVVATFVAFIIPGINDIARWFLFAFIGFFGAVGGGVVSAGTASVPYWFGVADPDRGLFRFRSH